MTQILAPFLEELQPRRKPPSNSYAEIKFCFLCAQHLHAGLTATTLTASAGLQNPSSLKKKYIYIYFLIYFSITLFFTQCQGAAEKSGASININFSAYLLKFTFPDDWRLGRCAESGSAGTPSAAYLLFLLISFPRSILCQIYSSGVGQYLYIYQLKRENKRYTLHCSQKAIWHPTDSCGSLSLLFLQAEGVKQLSTYIFKEIYSHYQLFYPPCHIICPQVRVPAVPELPGYQDGHTVTDSICLFHVVSGQDSCSLLILKCCSNCPPTKYNNNNKSSNKTFDM